METHLKSAAAEARAIEPAPEDKVLVPKYLTVSSWKDHFSWPSEGGLRHLIFHADTNGFAAAFKRVGSRVIINVHVFWNCVEREGTE